MSTIGPVEQVSTTRPAFDLFEGYAASSILAALQMADLLSALETDGISDDVVADRDPDRAALLRASLSYLRQRNLVRYESGRYTLTPYGAEVCVDKGYLVWLVGGYGEPLRRLDSFLGTGHRYGVDYVRDGKWVAGGAALLGGKDMVPHARKLLREIEFDSILDLGCGNARFLINACREFNARGVGIDISPEACADAERAVAEADMMDKIVITQADASALDEIDALAKTDLVVTFFLLHEILAHGSDVLHRYLADLRLRLPHGAHLLVAEVEPPSDHPTDPQRFTPEFTYVHALMRQTLLPATGWTQALESSGFTVRKIQPNQIPGGLLLLAQVSS
jgi:SAM-dependent methyltransferase